VHVRARYRHCNFLPNDSDRGSGDDGGIGTEVFGADDDGGTGSIQQWCMWMKYLVPGAMMEDGGTGFREWWWSKLLALVLVSKSLPGKTEMVE